METHLKVTVKNIVEGIMEAVIENTEKVYNQSLLYKLKQENISQKSQKKAANAEKNAAKKVANATKKAAEKQARELVNATKKQKKIFKKCLKQLKTKFNIIDGRHIARANETIRIKKIIEIMLDKDNILGKKLCQEYETKFNKQITSIKEAGTNTDHYDFIIYHSDGSFNRVEEKHSEKTLNISSVPWKYSVQVLNGVGSQFIVGEKYAQQWYNEVIVPTKWNDILNCSEIPEIPEYDEWVKDAFRCGDPVTPFVQKIKSQCREVWGGKTSFTGKNNTPDLRSILSNFTLTDEETKNFIQQINDKLDNALSQKDCFLQTKGDIDSNEFEFAWRDSVTSPNITNINIRLEKDIKIDLINKEKESFTGILRWGKGCGFTNIRFDVR